MPQLIIAIAILVGGYWLLRLFARTPPAVIARWIRGVGGASAIGAGLLLLLRGSFPAAGDRRGARRADPGAGAFPEGLEFRPLEGARRVSGPFGDDRDGARSRDRRHVGHDSGGARRKGVRSIR